MSDKLRVEALCASYRGRRVLDHVTFSARSGELTALLGRNGSGKTTLLRAISGVLRPDAGGIHLGALDLARLGRAELAHRVAYVPQLAAPPAQLAVWEAVHMCARSAETAQAAIGRLSLAHLANKRCDAISGGEWRRVLVAQGLAQLPAHGGVLLLDEPLAYVDAPGRRELLAGLRKVAVEREAVLLLALHEIELGGAYCQSAVLLHDGSVLAAGDYGAVAARESEPQLELVAEVA